MKYVLDRIEGLRAVLECENGGDLIIHKDLLPKLAKEGDIIEYINNEYIINVEKTDKAKESINEKMKKLIKNK